MQKILKHPMLVLCVFGLLFANGISAAEKTATPEETLKAYLIYLSAGDAAKVKQLTTAEMWKESKEFAEAAAGGAKTAKEKAALLKSCTEIYSQLHYKATISGNKAVVTAGTKNDKKPDKFNLVKENGIWKVSK